MALATLEHAAQDFAQLLTAELLLGPLLTPLERFAGLYTELAVSALAAVALPGVASAELGDGEACLLIIALGSSAFLRLCCQRLLGELLP